MSDFEGIEFVDVVALKPLDGHRLWLRFSNGDEGVADLDDIVRTGGPMFDPLKEQAFFEKVFLDTDVPAWPNGLDLDATRLHMSMSEAGAFGVAAAE